MKPAEKITAVAWARTRAWVSMLRSKLMRSGRLRVDSSAEETCGAE